jgi:transposase-like protein
MRTENERFTVEQAAKNWSMPLHDWNLAINQFMIWFEDRLPSTF